MLVSSKLLNHILTLINYLCKVCAKVTEDGFCLSQRPDPKLFHLPEQETMFSLCFEFKAKSSCARRTLISRMDLTDQGYFFYD